MTSHLQYLSSETIIHKTYTISSANDDAPSGLRTSMCGEFISGMEVHKCWKYVTCEKCKKHEHKKRGKK